MLAEEERQIPSSEQSKMGGEQRGDSLRAGKEPAFPRSILGEPAKGGGEKELSTGMEQGGEPIEESCGIGNPIE